MAEHFYSNQKVKLPSVVGSTTINHGARVKMALNCSEYVFMDHIYRQVQKKQEVDILEAFRKTGFLQDQQETLLQHLIAKGFILPINEPIPVLTTKWESAFADIDMEFEKAFWTKKNKEGKMTVLWSGSKKKSCTMYVALRKNYSREFIVEQRDQYVRYLEMEHKNGFNRSIMMCERWLRAENEYYLVDWKKMADDIAIKLGLMPDANAPKETLTRDQQKKKYEQDSDK